LRVQVEVVLQVEVAQVVIELLLELLVVEQAQKPL
jgi:hypothetical protein